MRVEDVDVVAVGDVEAMGRGRRRGSPRSRVAELPVVENLYGAARWRGKLRQKAREEGCGEEAGETKAAMDLHGRLRIW